MPPTLHQAALLGRTLNTFRKIRELPVKAETIQINYHLNVFLPSGAGIFGNFCFTKPEQDVHFSVS